MTGRGGVAAAWDAVRRPDDVDALLRALFGAPPAHAPAVLHVAAVAEAADGRRRVLREGPDRPPGLFDGFLLRAARARADALVTTGRILREEPHLHHGLGGHPAAHALAAWRSERAGLAGSPRLLVLTASGDLDPEHPALAGAPGAVVFTSEGGAARLAARRPPERLGVQTDPAPDARRAVRWLQDVAGASRITVEAGPTAAAALYAAPPGVDELWLAVREGPLPEAALGPDFVDRVRVEAALPDAAAPTPLDEPGGPWRIERRRAGR